MKLLTFLLTLTLFTTFALATDDFSERAYQIALELGVDPDGPYPTDFTEYVGNQITFAAGSKFSLWAAAQHSRKVKRAASGSINMTLWSTNACGGGGLFIFGVQYSLIYGADAGLVYNSVQLKGSVAPHTLLLTLGRGGACDTDLRHLSYENNPGCRPIIRAFGCVSVVEQ
ncbi:hypothetical protein BDD12DRAFT_877286 [Trichophaea hybrida]|nr:hypothetical protein BDD12DRAFT_877286 [Trichophaea hybrida]